MKKTIFTKKYEDPRGPLYPKLSFKERYNKEITLINWGCMVALTFLIGIAAGGW